jgi:UDP-N-acetyl-D-glucosamine/UDP-N-acetyl-D-galactosamine dehydrogenase
LKIRRKIAVIGLGYVGLPVAVAFARTGFPVIGFDIDEARVGELRTGHDRTGEVEHGASWADIEFTCQLAALKNSDFFIVAVPTHIDEARRPDLDPVFRASREIGSVLKQGDIVVYESTMYPGAVEEECIPVLERSSGMSAGRDFKVAYSPERINPGDGQHRFETVVKIVSAQDDATLGIVAEVYGTAVTAGVHRAPSIKIAEAAKVIENAQRDLNIAFVNELSLIFNAMNLDTGDVLAAARTKWNFLPFKPGLVGGHCIGVDPYYLAYRAQKAGYQPDVILAGRRINDGMSRHVARECARRLSRRQTRGGVVSVLGITYKENVPDIRNSKVVDLIEELMSFGITVQASDPIASPKSVLDEYGIVLTDRSELRPADAVILAVAHREYAAAGWSLVTSLLSAGRGLVLDLNMLLERGDLPEGVELWRP